MGVKEWRLPEELMYEVVRCYRCGFCRAQCPVFDVKLNESWNARGRVLIAKALAEGLLNPSKSVVDRVFSCTSCKACEVTCPPRIKVVEVVRGLRSLMVRRGFYPPRYDKVVKRVKETNSMFESVFPLDVKLGKLRDKLEDLPDKAENLLYVGCTAGVNYPEEVLRLVELLELSGVGFTVLKDGEVCCGLFLKEIGFEEEFNKLAKRLKRKIKEVGAKKVITLCPMCYTALKLEYGLTVVFYVDLLLRAVKTGRVHLKQKVDLKTAYKDPCHLSRWHGLYDPPRELLEACCNSLTELELNREYARCCGGPARFAYPDLTGKLRRSLVEDAFSQGIELLVTSCPTCYYNLSAASLLRPEVRVAELVDVVYFSAGLSDSPFRST